MSDEAKPPMSRGAARDLADRLEKWGPEIRSENERRLIVAALRFYARRDVDTLASRNYVSGVSTVTK